MPMIKIHDKDKDKEENMDMNKNMANISKSQKSIRKKKKISDTKGIMPNPRNQKTSSGLKISDKGLSISHVNDINYFYFLHIVIIFYKLTTIFIEFSIYWVIINFK